MHDAERRTHNTHPRQPRQRPSQRRTHTTLIDKPSNPIHHLRTTPKHPRTTTQRLHEHHPRKRRITLQATQQHNQRPTNTRNPLILTHTHRHRTHPHRRNRRRQLPHRTVKNPKKAIFTISKQLIERPRRHPRPRRHTRRTQPPQTPTRNNRNRRVEQPCLLHARQVHPATPRTPNPTPDRHTTCLPLAALGAVRGHQRPPPAKQGKRRDPRFGTAPRRPGPAGATALARERRGRGERQMPRLQARREPARSSVLEPFSASEAQLLRERERERERCVSDADASNNAPHPSAATPHHVCLKRTHAYPIPRHSIRPGSLSKEPVCAECRQQASDPNPILCSPGNPTWETDAPLTYLPVRRMSSDNRHH